MLKYMVTDKLQRVYFFLISAVADAPIKDIHTFIGTFSFNAVHDQREDVPLDPVPKVEPLTVENVLWSNTVLAAGSAVGFVVYTGSETRAVMNTSHPETKTGLLDHEINRLAKVTLASFRFLPFSVDPEIDSMHCYFGVFSRNGGTQWF